MRVMPLGTSSGRPRRDRNVSALAVDLGRSWLLVDCGEGTQHQLLRSPLSVHRLSAVLVTHLHGDHVLGLPGLLSSMGLEGRTAPLTVVAPTGLGDWLAATAALPILWVGFPLHLVELEASPEPGADGEPRVVAEVDGHRISTLPVRHRVPAHGYRIAAPDRPGRVDPAAARALGVPDGPDLGRLQRGESVTVAGRQVDPGQVVGPTRAGAVVTVLGDTVPCPAGVRLAQGADLLVHEATYLGSEAALAEQWMHSTAAGAAGVAAEAGARRLLVTHFSARYASVEPLVAEARARHEHADAAEELRWYEVGSDRTG